MPDSRHAEIGTEANPIEFVDGCTAEGAADSLLQAADLLCREVIAVFEGTRMTARFEDDDEVDDERHDARIDVVVAEWTEAKRNR
jgi:hypothetical protein